MGMVRTLNALNRFHIRVPDPEDLMETILDRAGGNALANKTSLVEEASYSSANTPPDFTRSLSF